MDLNTQNCCIVLTRVSTNQQDYTAQVDDLTNWANSLGFTNIKVISTKESGFKTFDLKEGFKQVVDFISCNKEYKTILVTELSRLSRRQTVLFQIKQYLVDNKIQLFVKDISFSLFDANGMSNFATDIIFNTFASMTEHEMNTKKSKI
ncbi:recombinase family protein [Bacteroides fragilis]